MQSYGVQTCTKYPKISMLRYLEYEINFWSVPISRFSSSFHKNMNFHIQSIDVHCTFAIILQNASKYEI